MLLDASSTLAISTTLSGFGGNAPELFFCNRCRVTRHLLIMTDIIYTSLEYFYVYSFLGWCTEVVYQAVTKGIVVNRGFLNGPVCPIYGFGVLAVFRLLEAVGDGELYQQNALVIFIFGVVLATLIELIGGWVLDKLFHARWWDYSELPFNFKGYICLEFSIIWGLGVLLVIRGVNPMATHLLDQLPQNIGWILIAIFSVLFIADNIVSVMVMVGLNKRLAGIDELRSKMRVVSDDLSDRLGTRALETAKQLDEVKVQAALARTEALEQAEQFKAEALEQAEQLKAGALEQAGQLRSDYEAKKLEFEEKRKDLANRILSSRHFGAGRLLRAFPSMKHRDHYEILEMLKKELMKRP